MPNGIHAKLLEGFNDAELAAILARAKHRRLEPGLISRHDAGADHLFLITAGHAVQYAVNRDGRRLPFRWVAPGNIIGGNAMLPASSHRLYMADTVMRTNGCALIWERRALRELVGAGYTRLLENEIEILMNETIAGFVGRRQSISAESAGARLSYLLLTLACKIGRQSAKGLEIEVDNEDLAGGAQLTVYTASRILQEWQRAGIVKKRRGGIVLLRPEELKQRVA